MAKIHTLIFNENDKLHNEVRKLRLFNQILSAVAVLELIIIILLAV